MAARYRGFLSIRPQAEKLIAIEEANVKKALERSARRSRERRRLSVRARSAGSTAFMLGTTGHGGRRPRLSLRQVGDVLFARFRTRIRSRSMSPVPAFEQVTCSSAEARRVLGHLAGNGGRRNADSGDCDFRPINKLLAQGNIRTGVAARSARTQSGVLYTLATSSATLQGRAGTKRIVTFIKQAALAAVEHRNIMGSDFDYGCGCNRKGQRVDQHLPDLRFSTSTTSKTGDFSLSSAGNTAARCGLRGWRRSTSLRNFRYHQ